MSAGYSPNPLIKKLGIKDGYRCLILNEPHHYVDLLGEIPSTAEFSDDPTGGNFDFCHCFVRAFDQLQGGLLTSKEAIHKGGMIWISWPKATSPLQADFNGNDVRSAGLTNGLVDTKVCAVDHDWSGMKFQYRKKDR